MTIEVSPPVRSTRPENAVLDWVLAGLRGGSLGTKGWDRNGYDLTLVAPSPVFGAVVTFSAETLGVKGTVFEEGRSHLRERYTEKAKSVAPIFYDLVSLLCLAGVLRSGPRWGIAAPDPHTVGYSLTAYGREWVKNVPDEERERLLAKLG